MKFNQQRPRNEKQMTAEQQKELLSYHKKGLDFNEVAALMRLKPSKVKNKAEIMGVSLRKRRNEQR